MKIVSDSTRRHLECQVEYRSTPWRLAVLGERRDFWPNFTRNSFYRSATCLQEIKQRPRPLSLYIFGKNSSVQTQILHEVSFGGGCINDVIMHICNSHLPFGGVGESGIGSYHGEAGFKTFSHFKSILKRPFWFELPIKYKPYKQWKLKVIRALLG